MKLVIVLQSGEKVYLYSCSLAGRIDVLKLQRCSSAVGGADDQDNRPLAARGNVKREEVSLNKETVDSRRSARIVLNGHHCSLRRGVVLLALLRRLTFRIDKCQHPKH